MAVRNYTPEARWKIGKIIAKLDKLHYKIEVGQTIWKRHVDQITNVGSHVSVTDDTKFEAEDKNISAGTNETTKAPFVLESGLVYSRLSDIPDPVPADFRSANSDSEPADIRSPAAPKTVSARVTSPSNPDPKHLDFKDPGATTSKISNVTVHFPKLTDSFYSQSSIRSTRRRKPPDRLTYGHS